MIKIRSLPGEDRGICEGPHGRYNEHRRTPAASAQSRKDFCTVLPDPRSEPVTVSSALQPHCAGTSVWHSFHYTLLYLAVWVLFP